MTSSNGTAALGVIWQKQRPRSHSSCPSSLQQHGELSCHIAERPSPPFCTSLLQTAPYSALSPAAASAAVLPAAKSCCCAPAAGERCCGCVMAAWGICSDLTHAQWTGAVLLPRSSAAALAGAVAADSRRCRHCSCGCYCWLPSDHSRSGAQARVRSMATRRRAAED